MDIFKLVSAERYDEERYKVDEQLFEDPMISILFNKINGFQVPVYISKYAYILIANISKGNPGFAQLLLKDAIRHGEKKDTRILGENKENVFKATFVNILSVSNACMEVRMEGWPEPDDYRETWYAQKLPDGRNAVDTKEYWMEGL